MGEGYKEEVGEGAVDCVASVKVHGLRCAMWDCRRGAQGACGGGILSWLFSRVEGGIEGIGGSGSVWRRWKSDRTGRG